MNQLRYIKVEFTSFALFSSVLIALVFS
jgi:hypothetical protein